MQTEKYCRLKKWAATARLEPSVAQTAALPVHTLKTWGIATLWVGA